MFLLRLARVSFRCWSFGPPRLRWCTLRTSATATEGVRPISTSTVDGNTIEPPSIVRCVLQASARPLYWSRRLTRSSQLLPSLQFKCLHVWRGTRHKFFPNTSRCKKLTQQGEASKTSLWPSNPFPQSSTKMVRTTPGFVWRIFGEVFQVFGGVCVGR